MEGGGEIRLTNVDKYDDAATVGWQPALVEPTADGTLDRERVAAIAWQAGDGGRAWYGRVRGAGLLVLRDWTQEGLIKMQARIDVPRPGGQLAPGRAVIAGVTWAPIHGVDDGPCWSRARGAGGCLPGLGGA